MTSLSVASAPGRARRDLTAMVGMIVFLASWAMMFAALFFAYALVRTHADVWPPQDLPPLPRALPALNTMVLVLSSAALQYGLAAIRGGRTRDLGPAIGAAATLGAIFLGLQAFTWRELAAAGLVPSAGTYPSVFFGLTGFHAAHVAVGLVALATLLLRARAGAFSAAAHLPVRLWTIYWHFVGVVWALMFLTIYLV